MAKFREGLGVKSRGEHFYGKRNFWAEIGQKCLGDGGTAGFEPTTSCAGGGQLTTALCVPNVGVNRRNLFESNKT